MASLFRVAVGSVALTSMSVSGHLLCATIGARYSLRRTVLGSSQTPAPIITFRTQQIPIFTALAQAHVLRAFDAWAVTQFSNTEADFRVRHGIAICFKVVAIQLCQAAMLSISERCGAQGLFDHNQISGLHVRALFFSTIHDVFNPRRLMHEASLSRKAISLCYQFVCSCSKFFQHFHALNYCARSGHWTASRSLQGPWTPEPPGYSRPTRSIAFIWSKEYPLRTVVPSQSSIQSTCPPPLPFYCWGNWASHGIRCCSICWCTAVPYQLVHR